MWDYSGIQIAQDKQKTMVQGCTVKVQGRGLASAFSGRPYAIKACVTENVHRSYKDRNIPILSFSQAVIKAQIPG
jgi:hypothetical protein